MLLVVGTSRRTNLPNIVARESLGQGSVIYEINPEPTVFTTFTSQSGGGLIEMGTTEALTQFHRGVSSSPL